MDMAVWLIGLCALAYILWKGLNVLRGKGGSCGCDCSSKDSCAKFKQCPSKDN